MGSELQTSQPPTTALQDRVRASIVEAAATVLAAEGSNANMSDVAAAAGVSRATLYRYFASREELMIALGQAAYWEASTKIHEANLDSVPFDEAIARATRALVQVGDHYIVMTRHWVPYAPSVVDLDFEQTMNSLFDRGRSEGAVAADLETPWLRDAYRGALVYGIRYMAENEIGVECAAALITRQFLCGAKAGG